MTTTRGDEGDFLGAELRRALQRLIPPVVHRMNNSLAILGGLACLRATDEEEELARAELERMKATLESLARVCRELRPRAALFDLDHVVGGVLHLVGPLAHAQGIELERLPTARPAVLRGSADRIGQMLTLVLTEELLVLKAGLARSTGRAEADEPPPRLRLRIRRRPGRLTLAITRRRVRGDVPDVLRAVARAADEVGIRMLLRNLGGATGLRLVFTNPVEDEPPEHPIPARHAHRVALHRTRGRILVLEGDESERELIAAMLTEAGYDVESAAPEPSVAGPETAGADLWLVDSTLLGTRPWLSDALERSAERLLFLGEPAPAHDTLASRIADPAWLPRPIRPGDLLTAIRRRLDTANGPESS